MPSIAVLIPAYNEELVLQGTIDTLVGAGFRLSDVYVVNDLSTDKTEAIARQSGVSVFTVQKNGGKARAQVAGLQHFRLCDRYDWIVFIDGDSKVHVEFLNAMHQAVQEFPDTALFVGQVKSVKNSHVFSAARATEYTFGHDLIKQAQHNFGVIFVSPGCASMYSSSMLRQLSIDHLTLAEDMDLTMQVHRHGGEVRYVSAAVVNTQDPMNLRDYYKQIQRWNRGFWQVVLKHRVFALTKKQRVDWYMMAITIDSMVHNRMVWLLGLGWYFKWNPLALLGGLAIDIGITMLVALYTAYRSKRFDVVLKAPLYFWLRPLSDFVNVKTFIEIVVLRRQILAWNKVTRYDHMENS